jgi:hypothetical protein
MPFGKANPRCLGGERLIGWSFAFHSFGEPEAARYEPQTEGERRMADLNHPLKDSYISSVGDALKPYAADLTAKGFDPTSRIGQLSGASELIENAVKLRKAAEKNASDVITN